MTTLTAQQKARMVDLHKQYIERQAAIKSRRAELVPHAQRTLDTDRQVGTGYQKKALTSLLEISGLASRTHHFRNPYYSFNAFCLVFQQRYCLGVSSLF